MSWERLSMCGVLIFVALLYSCNSNRHEIAVSPDNTIVFIGNNLCSRMINFGYFETEIYLKYPDQRLAIRNMCDGGNTPGFRPHAGRTHPWAFPGAEVYQTEYARNSRSAGHFEFPDEWLTRLNTDVIIAFFGFSESFEGKHGESTFQGELQAFVLPYPL